MKTPVGFDAVGGGTLVFGQTVVATDYLKTFVASIENLFGGELKSFATLMDRARRELGCGWSRKRSGRERSG